MNFDRIHNSDESSWKRPDPTRSIFLLKLHGSLNWLYCPTCNQIEITPKDKGAVKVFTQAKECFTCGTPMEPIIVPPTYFKEMQNVYLQQIYQKSDKILRNSKKIYICGYSLPDADLHIKYLLKRAELLNSNPPEFFIINNHKNKKEPKLEKKRFLQFFKYKVKVHYTTLSFEDFCNEGVSGGIEF
jgi:NAD-dependent SIR2 family protein deacetylase